LHGSVSRLVRRGMIRTALCRVLAAVIYVVLSILELVYRNNFPLASLCVFIFVQFMWELNAVADVMLRRRLESPKQRKEYKMSVSNTLKIYAKAGVQLAGAVLVAVLPLLSSTNVFNSTEAVNIAIVGVGAAVVWNTTNHPDWRYGKLVGSALITGLTALNSFMVYGVVTQAEIMQIVLAFVTTICVGLVPNSTPTPEVLQSNMNPESDILS
jgi:hypothetical protein